MENPWEKIPLSDYENHMRLDSVRQLQAMNELMKDQLGTYPVSSAIILGVAGGNGLEHVQRNKFSKVFGVDINPVYLKETASRYPNLAGILECLCIDLTKEFHKLPPAELVIANLVIEYIGYESFQKVLRHTCPRYASCVIQINMENNWVSDSPYLSAFDGLEQIHCQMEPHALEKAMLEIGYHMIKTLEVLLPNQKKLLQVDFERVVSA
ncbi:class I SAM-dependent methyltransferase [Neglectibacter caecimuris]|uniref:class I SAM-dependent methyltransferase n=1 Tax=Neglectibacter caecimuris TaxID=3093658 RepID=UPI002AC8F7B7|nr:class I SAM-dependent methyltransferase [Neglectibacter sp. M00184]